MADVKHTPGPWHVASVGHGSRYGAYQVDAWALRERSILRGDMPGDACAEREANARLIAAAPDLLAVAKAIAGLSCMAPEMTAVDYDAAFSMIVSDASAAIAKAEGR